MLEVLDGLVAKSIVSRETGPGSARYRLLETIREYGRDLLYEAGEEHELRARHCDWVASIVARAESLSGSQQVLWLDLIEREQENLRAALDFCLHEPGRAAEGLVIAAQCWLHWIARGHLGEARRWLSGLLEVGPEPSLVRGRALVTLAMVQLSGGDPRSADAAVADGLALALQHGDERTAAQCRLWGGVAAYMQNDFDRAEAWLTHAAAAFDALGDQPSLCSSWIQMGAVAGVRGDHAASELLFEQSRGLARQLADGWLIGRSTLTQGALLAHREGADRTKATELLKESLRASSLIGDRWAPARRSGRLRRLRSPGCGRRVGRSVGLERSGSSVNGPRGARHE